MAILGGSGCWLVACLLRGWHDGAGVVWQCHWHHSSHTRTTGIVSHAAETLWQGFSSLPRHAQCTQSLEMSRCILHSCGRRACHERECAAEPSAMSRALAAALRWLHAARRSTTTGTKGLSHALRPLIQSRRDWKEEVGNFTGTYDAQRVLSVRPIAGET
jgi:hypothetical protein